MMKPVLIIFLFLSVGGFLYMKLNEQETVKMIEVSHLSAQEAEHPRELSLPISREQVERSCKPTDAGPDSKVILVTGAAGFVGFHSSLALHQRGDGVLGIDNFNEYYPSTLKRDRQTQLQMAGVHVVDADLNDEAVLEEIFGICGFTHVLHLAAQAGVRYAVKNPGAYVHSNLAAFVTLFEVIRKRPDVGEVMPVVVYASSSSVYGLNTKVPFSEDDRVDRPASLYAATKKSNEMMAHTYNHIYGLSVTGLRFFTVYGPYGRPDMAYFSFANNIMSGRPIKIFQGPGGIELGRDFTFIDDIVRGCVSALDHAGPNGKGVAQAKVYNLGNTHPVNVSDFVVILEEHLGKEAKREYVPMPSTGDVLLTHADVSKAMSELEYKPTTSLTEGLGKFVAWYKEYYKGGAHPEQLNYKPARR
uniref:NAD-dependent epimerase/dehydratase domain-containing protein n=1 Tax=Pyramimonas obovata TaxID=1411642 RepID=A0A7S0RUS3_9CHLO|mmetsp:Transcript_6940/g.14023  ORF Transcript_6940/g.14023 Transcript_6940/m.14023 type:complete len:416 (+) Transcript_6940:248-1495(+)|eukprot:CAMPEP_0118935208 /NCGR_PEP_ID=MMETSP1169-20130426/15155_1 /TAXON_ID=36882 /ORGANISM="Pyramimonas obovata, Strain CCMP722" /LENGTH=415 /DNA_ID=CAMNT_0006878205 /DNA_START=239 /DNA_END=1486 /DNA_ORIENTATION=+